MNAPSLPDLLAALPGAVRDARQEDLPTLAGALAEAQARLQMRLQTPATPVAAGEQFLTPKEVAERLRVKPSHVYDQIRKGKLPGSKHGKYVRVPADALAQVLRQRTRGYTSGD
jgi:excisionase family DNA binding protein